MRLNKILRQVIALVEPLVKQLETQVKAWTKPCGGYFRHPFEYKGRI